MKQGRLFVPARDTSWLASHAAVPIADPIDDRRIRIYFSGRDERNRSHTGRLLVDLSGDEPSIVDADPVLAPGDAGMFDDSGAMGCWLVHADSRQYLYYVGWNRGTTVPFRNALGLAVSDDGGASFVRYEGPILDRSTCDPCFTASASVLIDNGVWRMWYTSGIGWDSISGGVRPRYHIKYAESGDGIRWRPTGLVAIDFASPDEHAISRPSVLKSSDGYRMWYSVRGEKYRIGYAESADGLEWERRADLDVVPGADAWEREMVEYPFVFVRRGKLVMLYNGNGYGETGIAWATAEPSA
jgi:hypothetical protein